MRTSHRKARPVPKTAEEKEDIRRRKRAAKNGGVYAPKGSRCYLCYRTVEKIRADGGKARVRRDGKTVCNKHRDAFKVV